MLKLNFKKCFQKKGYTLIELLISLAIASIVFVLLAKILKVSLKTVQIQQEINDSYLNSFYLSEYIKDEISTSDKIFKLDQNKGNIGFLILNISSGADREPYHYITYFHEDEMVYRKAFKSSEYLEDLKSKDIKLISGGRNNLMKNVESIEGSGINFEENTITIKYKIKGSKNSREFEEIVAMRNSVGSEK